MKKNQGFSIVEIIISLTITGLIIVSVGNVLASTHRLDRTSEQKEVALAYAKEYLEVVNKIKNDMFACRCSFDDCVTLPNQCKRTRLGGDNRICDLNSGYSTCWTEFANTFDTGDALHLELNSGTWQLAANPETIGIFTRQLNFSAINSDSNQKKVTVQVTWQESNQPKSVVLETVITAWQNLN